MKSALVLIVVAALADAKKAARAFSPVSIIACCLVIETDDTE